MLGGCRNQTGFILVCNLGLFGGEDTFLQHDEDFCDVEHHYIIKKQQLNGPQEHANESKFCRKPKTIASSELKLQCLQTSAQFHGKYMCMDRESAPDSSRALEASEDAEASPGMQFIAFVEGLGQPHPPWCHAARPCGANLPF